MKILFINHNSDLYGASRSLLRLAGRLAKDQHEVHAVLPANGPLATRLADAGVACHFMPTLAVIDRASFSSWSGRAGFLMRCIVSPFVLSRLILKLKPDLIHTNVSVIITSGVAACMTRRPHVLHVREFYHEFRRAWPIYRRYLARTSDRILCVSRAVANQFGSAGNVHVLHNGFPSSEFRPVDADRVAAFRRQAGVHNGAPLVGLPGRVKLLRKGQETFIEACARLAPAHADWRFLIIGSPFSGNEHHVTRLRASAASLGIGDRVVFFGECHDMQAAYAALDIVVMASGQPEPFGGTVIEAMAMGRPVVGTSVGGTPEQIEDGVSGLLVPPNDPEAMAAAIGKLLDDPALRRSMGESARLRFEQKFEFEEFYATLGNIYAGLLNSPDQRS